MISYVENYKNQYNIPHAKVDTDKADEISSKFDVHAVPTYILMRKTGGEINGS